MKDLVHYYEKDIITPIRIFQDNLKQDYFVLWKILWKILWKDTKFGLRNRKTLSDNFETQSSDSSEDGIPFERHL